MKLKIGGYRVQANAGHDTVKEEWAMETDLETQ